MMSDDLQADANKGARMETLLRDGLIIEAFAKLENEFIVAWKASHLRDDQGRERLWQAVQIVGKVPTMLQAVVSNGKLAQKQLDDITTLGERKSMLRRVL